MPPPKDVVWYLHIQRDFAGNVIVLTVSGRISHRTCANLATALATAIEAGSAGVVVDLSGVDYISSPGLRALEGAATRLAGGGRRFVMCGVQDPVSVAFSLAGLSGTLVTEPSRDAAVARAATTPPKPAC